MSGDILIRACRSDGLLFIWSQLAYAKMAITPTGHENTFVSTHLTAG